MKFKRKTGKLSIHDDCVYRNDKNVDNIKAETYTLI